MQAGLTQVQLAAFIGVTPNTIQNWEKEDGLDQLERYLKLAEILGCEVHDLVDFIETDDPEDQHIISFSIDDLRKLRVKWNLKSPNSQQDEDSPRRRKHMNESASHIGVKNKSSG
jgi:DNA-binding XRE family transcriptional regulator